MLYENAWGHKRRWEWISNRIRRNSDINTCLEVGCGCGTFISIPIMINNPNVKVYGVDIAEESIAIAKKNAEYLNLNNDSFFCKDIYKIDNKYDCVICSEVLEHIEPSELERFAKKVVDLVVENGYLIVTVPNGRGSYERGVAFRKSQIGRIVYPIVSFILSAINAVLFRNHNKKYEETNKNFVMTVSDSPHVNFFSKRDICELFLEFELIDFSGSNRFAGCFFPYLPYSSLLYKINNSIGKANPEKAAAYYFLFKKNG